MDLRKDSDVEKDSTILRFLSTQGHAKQRRLAAEFSAFVRERNVRFPLSSGQTTETCLDILLFLLSCSLVGRSVSISDIYLSAGVSKSSAIRWIAKLSRAKIIHRRKDERDQRRSVIVLDEEFAELLRSFIIHVEGEEQAASRQSSREDSNPERMRATLADALENAGLGIFVRGRPNLVNRKLADFLGYSSDELKDVRLTDLVHPDEREDLRRVIRSMAKGGTEAVMSERRFIRKDGRVVRAVMQVTVARNQAGRVRHKVAIIHPL